jgi:hypothetical protein
MLAALGTLPPQQGAGHSLAQRKDVATPRGLVGPGLSPPMANSVA